MQLSEQSNPGIQKARQFDIDWLRVILFGLLIWFHYAVFSLDQIDSEENNMELFNISLFIVLGVMHQWRLAALFVISGMGTAFAFRKRTLKTYVKERIVRLGLPLIFVTYFLFFGVFSPFKTLLSFLVIFPGEEGMPYGHLWFVYNLLIYSILLSPLFAHVHNYPEGRIVECVRSILRIRYGIGILMMPSIILAINGILFKPWAFGEVGMWWEFPRYLLFFLFGYLLISAKEEYYEALERIRVPITIVTPILVILWCVLEGFSNVPNIMQGGWVQDGYAPFTVDTTIATIVQSLHAWFWCLLIFSWASKFLNKPNKWLSYLNEAVYPAYIVHFHLTFLPIGIFGFLGIGYYAGLSIGTILVLIGVLICFESARRAAYFRVVFGMKGDNDEVVKIYPYNEMKSRNHQILFALLCHIITVLMIIGLNIMLISGGILLNEA